MLDYAERLGREFIGMRWKLLEAHRGNLFITFNNPLYVADPAATRMAPERIQVLQRGRVLPAHQPGVIRN